MIWAFAKMQYRSPAVDSMVRALTAVSLKKLRTFKALDLSNIAWACAYLGEPAKMLGKAAIYQASTCIGSFSPQGLSCLVFAAGRLGGCTPKALRIFADAVSSNASSFKPQGIANILTGYARLGSPMTPEVLSP